MKLALSILCENPDQKTGLSTLFHELVSRSLRLFPDISWLVFAGPNQEWTATAPAVKVVRDYPANNRLKRRLLADHYQVSPRARAEGAHALVTVGFVPARKTLPTAMHLLSLQHLDKDNRLGFARQLYRHWVMHRYWPKADLIIVNSNFTVQQTLAVFPQFKNRMIKSYEGVDHSVLGPTPKPGEFDEPAQNLGLRPNYLLWVGNLYPYKQPDLMVRAYARLPPSLRNQHPLVMVGGNWIRTLENTQALARDLGVLDNIVFPGWIPEHWLAPLYRHALAFCLASREETFGRGVAEAMACGTPCVVNDIPVMHEVTHGAALIVDFNDPDAVARALQNLIQNQNLRQQLRDKGLQRAQLFNFDTLTIERITAIRQLVSGNNAGPGQISTW